MTHDADTHPEDLARAGFYTVLAGLLVRPGRALVQALADQPEPPGDDALARGWTAVVHAAREGCETLRRDHAALFVAAGTPPLNPYESFYASGTLMDRSLSLLRQDLARLGLARGEGVRELEDHLGALCDAMRELVTGGAPAPTQAAFFMTHLAPWARLCLADIAAHPQAGTYAAVAAFGDAFLAGEQEAFEALAALAPPTPMETPA